MYDGYTACCDELVADGGWLVVTELESVLFQDESEAQDFLKENA
jgi:hypothetical protein